MQHHRVAHGVLTCYLTAELLSLSMLLWFGTGLATGGKVTAIVFDVISCRLRVVLKGGEE